jgi:hypothetical protein
MSPSTARLEAAPGAVRAAHKDKLEGAGLGVTAKGGAPKGRRVKGMISASGFTETGIEEDGAATEQLAPGVAAETGGKQDRTEKTTGGTKVKMKGEADAQVTVIVKAVARAKQMVDNAIGAGISAIKDGGTGKAVTAAKGNFHSASAKVAKRLASDLSKLSSALGKSVPIEVVMSETGARGYVYTGFYAWFDNEIHLGKPWFEDPDPDNQARTIIHEASHKYCGTDDKGYHWETAKYNGLSEDDALNNADCYAWFCMDCR